MNKISLSQICIQNQQPSSWNDDPFNLRGNFAGVANMNHQISLSDFALDLVSTYAHYSCDQFELSLDMLGEDDQNELVRLYIDSTGRDLTECVNGSDFSIENDYTCALLALLKNDCQETRDTFADITRKNILTYYKDSLNELLVTACDTYLNSQMSEQGFYSSQDREHGDVVWGKF